MPTPKRLRGRALQALRRAVFAQQPLCLLCSAAGRIARSEELDHVVPLHRGGTDARENLRGLCRPCHAEVTAADQGHTRGGCDAAGFPLSADHHWRKGQTTK